ncbi:class II aldolase/adducin family protein [Pseudarthrobacter raffinosi]|uniref:class II aldolase/adducin family protein n=1 Tax=Pseudarthrobacter raffinosi TaxID=2953651 RepID=UPI00208E5F42|nr:MULTISPECIES: class II aldolase/adducin family protein [unclassified Pseudarthrobacter]MCO4251569.1 class II aldolase/adducin family protein [Pseudarthrobacter sp. MDT3-9]MCO4264582.1 class II aldolase/adducin family protein [Pseudarthrobacter sp. MDT3-26]
MRASQPPVTHEEHREAIALACRVLAHRGLADGILGHISLRMAENKLLVRCRGPQERGLAYTEARDIRLVDLDGNPAAEGELDGGYTVPNELPLHTELLRRRPDINAVVHAHPPRVVAADLAGLRVRPIVGAFDIPGTRLAAGGIPIYPRGVLVRNHRLAGEMIDAMSGRPVVLLRGHGLTSAAPTVEQAVLQAISVDTLAGLALQVTAAGGQLQDLPDTDMAELPDLGGSFNTGTAWRHELARLGIDP